MVLLTELRTWTQTPTSTIFTWISGHTHKTS